MTEDFSGGNHNIVTEHISQTDASTTGTQANKPKIKKPPRKSKIQQPTTASPVGNTATTEEKAVRTTSSCQSEPSRQTTPGTRYFTLINHLDIPVKNIYVCVFCSTLGFLLNHYINSIHPTTLTFPLTPKNIFLGT